MSNLRIVYVPILLSVVPTHYIVPIFFLHHNGFLSFLYLALKFLLSPSPFLLALTPRPILHIPTSHSSTSRIIAQQIRRATWCCHFETGSESGFPRTGLRPGSHKSGSHSNGAPGGSRGPVNSLRTGNVVAQVKRLSRRTKFECMAARLGALDGAVTNVACQFKRNDHVPCRHFRNVHVDFQLN